MDENTFWALIEKTHQQSGRWNLKQQRDLLTEELMCLSSEEIVEFHMIFREMRSKSYMARLWEAAFVIACGCSDSGFDEFRGWLIAQGRTVFENALHDPESLVDVIEPQKRYNIIDGNVLSASLEAYERKTGQEMPPKRFSTPLIGELRFTDDEEAIYLLFPRLAAVFSPDCED